MENPVLFDKTKFPTDEVVFAHIGKSAGIWNSFFATLRSEHPDIKAEWRYYNDGKSWLMKVVRKSKTVFWLKVLDGGFRVAFYFTDKANEPIRNSTISDDLKKQFKTGEHYGKLRGLTVLMKNKKSLNDALKILEVKLALK